MFMIIPYRLDFKIEFVDDCYWSIFNFKYFNTSTANALLNVALKVSDSVIIVFHHCFCKASMIPSQTANISFDRNNFSVCCDWLVSGSIFLRAFCGISSGLADSDSPEMIGLRRWRNGWHRVVVGSIRAVSQLRGSSNVFFYCIVMRQGNKLSKIGWKLP